jgi:hypothetical protein
MLTVAVLPGHTLSDFDSPAGLHPPLLEGGRGYASSQNRQRRVRLYIVLLLSEGKHGSGFFAEFSTACATYAVFAPETRVLVMFLRRGVTDNRGSYCRRADERAGAVARG